MGSCCVSWSKRAPAQVAPSSSPSLSLSSSFVSAGKSFLLTTVFLWCLVEGIDTKAAAPTGIAAANVEIQGTQDSATTVHNLFDFTSEHVSQLDFSTVTQAKMAAPIQLRLFLLDDVSMLNYVCYNSSCNV